LYSKESSIKFSSRHQVNEGRGLPKSQSQTRKGHLEIIYNYNKREKKRLSDCGQAVSEQLISGQ
jgi:hypothetical protein